MWWCISPFRNKGFTAWKKCGTMPTVWIMNDVKPVKVSEKINRNKLKL
jgi:hypothetical protein